MLRIRGGKDYRLSTTFVGKQLLYVTKVCDLYAVHIVYERIQDNFTQDVSEKWPSFTKPCARAGAILPLRLRSKENALLDPLKETSWALAGTLY